MPDTRAFARADIGRLAYIRVSLFAAMLASAGIPLYILLPQFGTLGLGLSLSTLGLVLLALRVIDFAQDPMLGRMVDRFPALRRRFVALAVVGLAGGFAVLFRLEPSALAPLWFFVALAVIFTAYSLATILFYRQGLVIAGQDPVGGHFRLAGYRETGALLGLVLIVILPELLRLWQRDATLYPDFGLVLAGFVLMAAALTRPLWRLEAGQAPRGLPLKDMLAGRAGWLLALALVNALPVAITSVLFLFFVDQRLGLAPWAGAFLVLFFLSAGLCAPLWARLVQRFGARAILPLAMVLAIAGFGGAAVLQSGAAVGFALVCIASGAALGADMVILPALFARALAQQGLPAGLGFGLWSFAAKLALAVAAATVLPALGAFGFDPAGGNSAIALAALAGFYAILPCALKILAIAMVLRLPAERTVS